MERRSTSNSFETFLKSVGDTKPPGRSESSGRPSPLRMLLEFGPMSLTRLQEESGLGDEQFTAALKTMEDEGLIEISEVGGDRVVALTPVGQTVAGFS